MNSSLILNFSETFLIPFKFSFCSFIHTFSKQPVLTLQSQQTDTALPTELSRWGPCSMEPDPLDTRASPPTGSRGGPGCVQ